MQIFAGAKYIVIVSWAHMHAIVCLHTFSGSLASTDYRSFYRAMASPLEIIAIRLPESLIVKYIYSQDKFIPAGF